MTANLQFWHLHFTAGLNIHKLKQYSYITCMFDYCPGSLARGHGSPCLDPWLMWPIQKCDPFDPLTYDPSTPCLLWLQSTRVEKLLSSEWQLPRNDNNCLWLWWWSMCLISIPSCLSQCDSTVWFFGSRSLPISVAIHCQLSPSVRDWVTRCF